MKLIVVLYCLVSISGAFGDEFYKCYWIAAPQIDCARFEADPTCGTDRVTYANRCEFSKAHCNDDTIDLRHIGACTSADMTTPAPVVGGGTPAPVVGGGTPAPVAGGNAMSTHAPVAGGNTPAPVAGGDVVFDFMCTSLSHKDCPVGGAKVCAADGMTYDNFCEYEKAKCTHQDLYVVTCTV